MKREPEVEVVDLEWKDTIFRSRSATHAQAGVLADESLFMHPPEEYMDRIEKVLGDANARVSVTGNIGVSDYGNKASASVTVTLTCNQSEEAVVETHGIAKEIMKRFLEEDQREMEALLDGGSGKSAAPAAAAPAKSATPSKISMPAVAQTAKPAVPGVGKPNFKRS